MLRKCKAMLRKCKAMLRIGKAPRSKDMDRHGTAVRWISLALNSYGMGAQRTAEKWKGDVVRRIGEARRCVATE